MVVNMNQFLIPPFADVHTNHVAVQEVTVISRLEMAWVAIPHVFTN